MTLPVDTMNRYVGTANTRPASRRPRRLPYNRMSTMLTVMVTCEVWPRSAGRADVSASVPAAVCTATVTV